MNLKDPTFPITGYVIPINFVLESTKLKTGSPKDLASRMATLLSFGLNTIKR